MNPHRTWIAVALLAGAALAADFTFEIPPVPESVEIGGQTVAITIAGEVSASPQIPGASDQSFSVNLRADLGDFQAHLTPILQAELNKSERCGDRISIQNATLAPAAPSANLTVHLHFEKWMCIKALGDSAKKLLGGDGTVHVILTPQLENSAAGAQTVRLDADMGDIEANGLPGELLRSGSVGTALRDRIREELLKAVRKSTDLEVAMPAQARRFVTIQKIGFADGGFGRLALDLGGQLRVPGEQVSTVLEQLGNR